MKVKCTHCGKRFDFELHTGLCPNCATYNSTQKEASNFTYEDSKPQEPKQSTPKKQLNRFTVVLIILIISCAILTSIITQLANQSGYEASSLSELITPTSLSTGDILPYEVNNTTIYLQITGASIETDEAYEMPEGYEAVKISYKISHNSNMQSVSGVDSFSVPYSFEKGLRPYLLTKSGVYLKPVSWVDIKDARSLSYEEIDALGIGDTFEHLEGNLYFVVKENDTASLLINCYQADTEPEQLVDAYIIDIPEVR